MPEANNTQDERLRCLWERRGQLTPAEFVELYQLVHAVLLRYATNPAISSLLQQLPYETEDYIQQFITYRIVQGRGGNVYHAGALCLFFRNFLLDCVESERIPGNFGTGGDPEAGEGSVENENLPLPPGWQPAQPVVEAVLAEAGLTMDTVREKARAFLAETCQPADRIMLRRHYFTDNTDEYFLHMVHLAEAYTIPAYHYRATQLGVVIPGALHAAGARFFDHYAQHTHLGRWFTGDLGCSFAADQREIFSACLQILSDVTLNEVSPIDGTLRCHDVAGNLNNGETP